MKRPPQADNGAVRLPSGVLPPALRKGMDGLWFSRPLAGRSAHGRPSPMHRNP